MSRVDLSDEELVMLDGQCGDDTQQAVDAAKARLRARDAHPDLPPRLAGFVADAVTEAQHHGLLVYYHTRLRRCPLCKRSDGYAPFKSGPRKGRPNFDRPLTFAGVELARRFVSVQGQATLGGCTECVQTALPALREALHGVTAQLPDALRLHGAPKRVRHDRRRCTECGWEGHEGEMGRVRTLMGDGTYPGQCPSCGAVAGFGSRIFESLDGFEVVEVPA